MSGCSVWWCVVAPQEPGGVCLLHARYPLAHPQETRDEWTARVSPAERAAAARKTTAVSA